MNETPEKQLNDLDSQQPSQQINLSTDNNGSVENFQCITTTFHKINV